MEHTFSGTPGPTNSMSGRDRNANIKLWFSCSGGAHVQAVEAKTLLRELVTAC